MDFQQRIAEATQYRDQTKASYDAAQRQTGQAQSAYDTAISTAPTYQTIYEQSKLQNGNSQEIADAKNTYTQAKQSTDTIKSMIDNLPTSITQQFGGTGLTQAQRDMAKQKQLQDLNKSFTQYNADYEVKFNNYNDMVDKAFDTSLDVANKNYDSYWDGVRRKFGDWQTSIKNQENWSSMYNTSQSQLSKVQSEYQTWQIKQQTLQMQREFEQWRNDFAAQQRATAANGARAGQAYAENAARLKAEADNRFRTDTALFQQGKLSTTEYLRRMDAGQYRT